uniref:Uncharacterized protein n=1 Tax=Myotis myotis TaxID=51298 RepID=A0A7J7VIG2_MYOMY|nr:hypothetical protein mMyoMyo1_008266 [Myotis myotis]
MSLICFLFSGKLNLSQIPVSLDPQGQVCPMGQNWFPGPLQMQGKWEKQVFCVSGCTVRGIHAKEAWGWLFSSYLTLSAKTPPSFLMSRKQDRVNFSKIISWPLVPSRLLQKCDVQTCREEPLYFGRKRKSRARCASEIGGSGQRTSVGRAGSEVRKNYRDTDTERHTALTA